MFRCTECSLLRCTEDGKICEECLANMGDAIESERMINLREMFKDFYGYNPDVVNKDMASGADGRDVIVIHAVDLSYLYISTTSSDDCPDDSDDYDPGL